MKKFLYPIYALAMLAMVSCTDDDDKVPAPEPMPTNAVSYNSKNYDIDNGTIIDWGFWENHYNYDVFLTDGIMDFENETAPGATFVIYAELWSPGTEDFSTGTFTFDDSGNTAGKRFFENLTVVIDSNNSGELDEEDDELTAKAGTFKISGSGTRYSVEMDVMLSNNKAIKGTYSGTFEKFEGTLEEMPGGRQRAEKPAKLSFK